MRTVALSVLAVIVASLVQPASASALNPHPIALHSEHITLPRSHGRFGPGKGAGLANGYCRICHSADFMYTQPPLTKAAWTIEVVKMQKALKCPVPNKDVAPLVAYFYQMDGKK